MGGSSSKPTKTTRYVTPDEAGRKPRIGKDYKEVVKNMNRGILTFNRCVSMTFYEYENKEHIPEGFYTKTLNINIKDPNRDNYFDSNTDYNNSNSGTKSSLTKSKFKLVTNIPGIITSSIDSLNPSRDQSSFNTFTDTSGDNYLDDVSKKVENELRSMGDVPAPIYVMCAKKMEFDGTMIDDTVNEFKNEYNDAKNKRDRDIEKIRKKAENSIRKEREKREKNIAKKDKEKDKQKEREKMQKNISKKERDREKKIAKKQKKFDKKYGDQEFFVKYWENNSNKAKDTILAKYVWKGDIEVIIYIPNLSNRKGFLTNMGDYKIQNMWMDTLAMENALLYNTYSLNEFKYNSLRKLFPSEDMYKRFIKRFKDSEGDKRPFLIDQRNHCLNGGCVSDTGENLNALLPPYDSKEKTLRRNADRNSPYYPQKCLRPLDFNENGVGYKDDQKFMQKELPKYMKDKCLKKWMKANKDFQKSKDFSSIEKHLNKGGDGGDDEDDSDPDLEGDLLDHLDNCSRERLRKKRGGKKHYRKWNRNIMMELAERHRRYPGVQEIVFPLFKVRSNINSIYSNPWGDRLLTIDTSLTEGETVPNAIFSSNRMWSLKVNNLSQVALYRNGVRIANLSSTQRRGYSNHTLGLFQGSLVVNATKGNGNEVEVEVKNIPLTRGKGYNSPLSLVIMNNGRIRLFGDGFVDVLDPSISNKINGVLGSLGFGDGNGNGNGDGNGDIDAKDLIARVNELERSNESRVDDDLYEYQKDIKERLIRINQLFSNSVNK